MGFQAPIQYDDRGYSQIILSHDGRTRYRYIKNPSFWIRLYYLKMDNTQIYVKLYPWDK